ncbi:CotH kinase family protein [Aquirufa antheringensis]|uniref:CotH kinase family protein n=1 Tax=Aquirufa antheringensis TaxID=2516559 RepID=UPI003BAFFD88
MKKHLICFLLLLPSFLYSQSLSVSNLPIVRFNTNTRVIQDEPKIPVQMEIFDKGPGQLNQVSSTPTISTVAGVEFRGSTSQADFYFLPGLVKKPYGIELWTDSTGVKAKKLSLLQMPEETDWVLNASYNDRSFMRDFIAQSLAGRIGLLHSKAKFVELIINDEYRGVYVLMEKVKQGKNRVPISDLYPTENAGDDVTGGYLLKIDKTSGSPSTSWKSNYTSGITATQKCEFQIEYPQYGLITQQQLVYIRDYINNWEKKLMTEDMNDPKASFRDYMDVSSFVNYFILNEVTRNVDGYRLSTYLYKDKESLGGKIKMGPAWDFNISFGNADYLNGWKTDGFVYNTIENLEKTNYWQVPFWWNKLMQDASFRKALATRWKTVRSSFLNTNTLFATIDSAQIALKDPLIRNFQKYPLMGKKIWPNYYVGASLSDEVNWLKNWIQGRLVWLDAQMAVFDSPILAVREEDASAIVYPNPSTSGLFQWKFSLDKPSLVTYFISDAMGRMILSPKNANFGSGEQIQSLDLSMFPSGTYLLSWKMEDGLVQQIKILR